MGRLSPRVLVPAVVAGGVLVAAGVAAAVLTAGSSSPAGRPNPGAVATHGPVPRPVVSLVGDHRGLVSWQQPLTVAVRDGRLQSVAVVLTGSADPLAGKLSADGSRWTS